MFLQAELRPEKYKEKGAESSGAKAQFKLHCRLYVRAEACLQQPSPDPLKRNISN
jgi:hypothetical protein